MDVLSKKAKTEETETEVEMDGKGSRINMMPWLWVKKHLTD